MTKRTKPIRPNTSTDTCHCVTVFGPDCEPAFDLLLYGLTESDIYTVPNEYVSTALNRRNLPFGYSVSIFCVERIR